MPTPARRSYGKIPEALELPNLIEIQKKSYDDFLQRGVEPDERADKGLESVFREMLKAEDYKKEASIEYVSYSLGKPKYDIDECSDRGMTYAIPLKVKVRFILKEDDPDSDEKRIKEARESEVYMGEIPLMTERGTFIVNGVERVVVSQLHRSPGVIFKEETQTSGRKTYTAQLIPIRGGWLEFESDANNVIHARADKHKRQPAATFLRALFAFEDGAKGSDEEIVSGFFKPESYDLYARKELDADDALDWIGKPLAEDAVDTETGEVFAFKGEVLDESIVAEAQEVDASLVVYDAPLLYAPPSGEVVALNAENALDYLGFPLAEDAFDTETGEVFAFKGDPLTEEIVDDADGFETRRISVLVKDDADADSGAIVPVDEEEYGVDEIPAGNPLKRLIGRISAVNIRNEADEKLLSAGQTLDGELLRLLTDEGVTHVVVAPETMEANAGNLHLCLEEPLAEDAVDAETGDIIAKAGDALTEELFAAAKRSVVRFDAAKWAEPILNSLAKDDTQDVEEAVYSTYYCIQPGDDRVAYDAAKQRIESLYFLEGRYDLSRVGRYQINKKLHRPGEGIDPTKRTLDQRDIRAALRQMLDVMYGKRGLDDVDHLANRRVRAVGELIENVVRQGLYRIARNIRDRMTGLAQEIEQKTPNDFIIPKPLMSALKDFFGSSQLSQFMSQNNPLDELVHRRRITALGPGGLSRERATYDARDVHHTHYGRICPIQTPEGPGVGLILYLSVYTKVNEYGFLETPYQKVEQGKAVDGAIEYLTADREDVCVIAPGNTLRAEDGALQGGEIITRHQGDYPINDTGNVDYIDVSPKQLVGISASLIPFLEHDDAVRALMGANYQGQAVPLLKPDSPVVGTGVEQKAALDSGAVVVAKNGGVVESVTADEIIVRSGEARQDSLKLEEGEYSFSDMGYDVYQLKKYKRSNSDTLVDQRPIVLKGQQVAAGDVIADGSSTDKGEIAVGANVLVAFMPWDGYNFEDAILISERLVRDDILTSIHIKECDIEARDTKLGNEEITRDIPNKSEEALRNLDEEGVVQVGSYVEPWEILVGKIAPKGESELGPEEKLLRAIFGDKVKEYKDASLEARPGAEGVVIDTRVFARKERDRDRQSELREEAAVMEAEQQCQNRVSLIRQGLRQHMKRLLIGETLSAPAPAMDGKGDIGEPGETVTDEMIEAAQDIDHIAVADREAMDQVRQARQFANARIREVNEEKNEKIEKIRKGDELKPGVLKLVKAYIAAKRKISVGDKLSGRHGNKGVIAKILPIEDMPYLEDGQPVDMVLNPLGVPGRMNVGQILETHLGWAAERRGFKVSTPVFDGASETEIQEELVKAGLPPSGKVTLYDGRTGEAFHQKVAVGVHYILKLNHLAADKLHARAIGPYSLVTQQPLGGKAQLGGQRFGEMEVWALEAYGASHLLQELLTIKSDDVGGRARVYEAMVKGENTPDPGIPESFNVLVKELQSLCLDVTLEEPGAERMSREPDAEEETESPFEDSQIAAGD